MKRVVAVVLLFYSAFVLGSASNDFNAGFNALKNTQYKIALALFKSGFSKIEAGEFVAEKEMLSAKIGMATAYVAAGDINKARNLITPLLKQLESNGPQDIYIAALQALFYVHFFAQEDQQALDVLSALIKRQKNLPFSAQAINFSQQAMIYNRNGDTLAAISSQWQVVKLYKKALPLSVNELLDAYDVLVNYSENIGDNKTALEGLSDKLELMLQQDKLNEKNIYNTKIRIKSIKKRLSQQGPDVDNPYETDWQEMFAKKVDYDVQEIQKQLLKSIDTFGEDSAVAAEGYVGYGDALAASGETEYALQIYNIAQKKIVKLYGNKSPNVASLYFKRANARKYSVFSDLEISDSMRLKMNKDYRRSVKVYSTLYGDAHPLTIASLHALYESERLNNDYELIFGLAKRLFTAYSEYEKSSFSYLSRKQKLVFRKQYKDVGQHFIEASWLSQAKAPNDNGFGEPYPEIDFSQPNWQAIHDKKIAIYNNNLSVEKARKHRFLETAFESWINHKGSINAVDNTLTLTRNNTNSQSLRNKIDKFFSLREELTTLPSRSDDWQKQQTIRVRLRNKLDTAFDSLKRNIPKLAFDRKITLSDLQNKIPENAIYLDFVKLYTYQYAVFSLDAKGQIRLIRLGDDSVSIEQRVNKIRSLINDTIDGNIGTARSERLLKKELTLLYDKTIAQISNVVAGFDELIISAEGLLALMPMGLLYDKSSNKYLLEKYTIRTAPSARALIRHSHYRDNKAVQTTIFADPDFNFGAPLQKSLCTQASASRTLTLSVLRNFDKPCIGRLPATATEAASISKIFNNSNSYMQAKATEKALFKLKRPDILHIATHGFFLPDPSITNPLEKSGLILSGANMGIANKTGEGVVTGLELASMDLLGTKLVVLSACETGLGDIEQGEGVAGLSQAFLRAGAQGVVMSLWRVPDTQTAELMKHFYRSLKEGMQAPSALRKAQQSFIKQGKHPVSWAAFAYSG